MQYMIVIYSILSLPLALYSIYFFLVGIAAFKNRKTVPSHAPAKKFAVLIAARNEEKVIANLIDSLKHQDYPARLYDIFVIPNNCTDQTENIAAAVGARILHIQMPVRTKGDVLRQAFEALQGSGYDGYVMFDADNVASPNFLQRMNDALCEGYPAAQGRRDGKNPKDSWVSGSYTIYFGAINYFINRPRMNLSRNANISGTGFMISEQLLAETGYPIRTITEDMEYTIICALKHKCIAFVEDAVIYDEQPVKFTTSIRQRRRWSAGTCLCCYTYLPKLISASLKDKNRDALDIMLLSMGPIVQVVFTVLPFLLSLGTLHNANSLLFNILGLLNFVVGYLLQVLFSGMISVMQGFKVKERASSILMFPIFLFSWFFINLYCLFTRNVAWAPINHSHTADIRQLYSDRAIRS